jgi:bifunctional DNA-binding transcriptional regulator/antitoxin component of YhaV-PrlF toxin-antitoxin module
MNAPSELQAQVDTKGRLALPSDLLVYFGLEPGVQVRVDKRSSGLHLRQPVCIPCSGFGE